MSPLPNAIRPPTLSPSPPGVGLSATSSEARLWPGPTIDRWTVGKKLEPAFGNRPTVRARPLSSAAIPPPTRWGKIDTLPDAAF